MMTQTELALACLALLATPGPTNTLMALAGAERGVARALRLIPAELAGYLLMVVPLALAGAPLFAALPQARAAVAVAAGLWVAFLAVKLWRMPQTDGTGPMVSARAVFVTTLLNPKALVFGLVLLPDPANTLPNIAVFSVLVALVAVLWALAGSIVGRTRESPSYSLPILRRAASVWLGGLAVVLLLRGAGLA
jgi:threonine/homoserine/homoserine lactone efflux protein